MNLQHYIKYETLRKMKLGKCFKMNTIQVLEVVKFYLIVPVGDGKGLPKVRSELGMLIRNGGNGTL